MAFDQLTSLPNDKYATFQVDKMTIRAKWQVDKIAIDKMTS